MQIEPLKLRSTADTQRLRRIGELLCKAVMLAEADRALQVPPEKVELRDTTPLVALPDPRVAADDNRIVDYLGLVGTAAPAGIRGTLGLSRSGLHRAMRRLAAAGCVVSTGNTRGVVYRLNRDEPSPERIGLN
jgi:hypothetical protein